MTATLGGERERGNSYFTEGRYEQALGSYSEAILGQWSEAVEDCQQAIQLDPKLVKGHFYMGQAFIELLKFDDAIVCLKTAHELAKQQRKNYGEDITGAIRYAKKMRWKALEDKRLQEGSEFQTFLSDLLTQHRNRSKAELEAKGLSEEDTSAALDKIHQEYEKNSSQLTQLFQQADEKRKCREVPDYMCGKISFELMTDPYITPSGITYDKKDIEEHLQKVGHFDPVTREELTQEQLIPNLAMKEVVDAFVSQNDWVEDY